MNLSTWRAALLATAMTTAAFCLAGCEDGPDYASNGRSLAPIPQKTVALMQALGSTESAPVLFRA